MRFKNKKAKKYGETRVVTRFLFLPLSLVDETRWLEKTTIKQKAYRSIAYESGFGAVPNGLVWVDEEFID